MLATQTLLNFSDAERPLGERLLKLAAETDRIEGYREPHSNEIARLAEKLGQRLGLHGPDLSALKFAALAHDLGERSMKRDYLLRPGSLTWEEQLDLWRHPIIGEQAAAELKLPRLSQLLIRWHHEWWNGQGYPDGLAGTAIPLGARILRVIDTYCALFANRPHRGKLELPIIEQFIADQAGVEADPQVAKEFLALLEEERPASIPVDLSPDLTHTDLFANAADHTTTPPEADETDVEVEIPPPPSLSAFEPVRHEFAQPALSWQGLSNEEAKESWPATQDVPALNEPALSETALSEPALSETALSEPALNDEEATNTGTGANEAEPALASPPNEFIAADPIDEPLTELLPAPVDTIPLAPPQEPLEELSLTPEAVGTSASEVTIVSLSDAPDHFWPVAQWLYDQWWALPSSTINVVSDQLKEHLAGQPLPSTLVAVVDGQPVGSISLHEYAIAERPDLTPCLAALYVRPEQRQHGIASRLLDAAETRLRDLGATRFYFTVPEHGDFFAKRGWQVLEPAVGAQTLIILVKE